MSTLKNQNQSKHLNLNDLAGLESQSIQDKFIDALGSSMSICKTDVREDKINTEITVNALDLLKQGILPSLVTKYRKVTKGKPDVNGVMLGKVTSIFPQVEEAMKTIPHMVIEDRNQVLFANTNKLVQQEFNRLFIQRKIEPEEKAELFAMRKRSWVSDVITEYKPKEEIADPSYLPELNAFKKAVKELKYNKYAPKVVSIMYFGLALEIPKCETQGDYSAIIDTLDDIFLMPDKYRTAQMRRNNIHQYYTPLDEELYEQFIKDEEFYFRAGVLNATLGSRIKGETAFSYDLVHLHDKLCFNDFADYNIFQLQVNHLLNKYSLATDEKITSITPEIEAELIFTQNIKSLRAYEQHKQITSYKALTGVFPKKAVKLSFFGLSCYLWKDDAYEILYHEILPQFVTSPFTITGPNLRRSDYPTHGEDAFASSYEIPWLTPQQYDYFVENDLMIPKAKNTIYSSK